MNNPTVEVLVASLQNDDERALINRLNLQTNAVISNQTDYYSCRELEYDSSVILWLDERQRGVGRNRNNLLNHMNAEFCILSDDDMRFRDGYEQIVLRAFESNPDADIIVFNIGEKKPTRYVNKDTFRIGKRKAASYGAARIAFRSESILKKRLNFSTYFGGGAKYGSGEDTIFLYDCLKCGLKIYASPDYLADLDDCRESTWFRGFTDEYLLDKGALFRAISPLPIAALHCLVHSIRHHRSYGCSGRSFAKTFALLMKGAVAFDNK